MAKPWLRVETNDTVKLWKRDGSPIAEIKANQASVISMSWSPDGQTLATGGTNDTVKLWKRDGLPITEIKTNQQQCQERKLEARWPNFGHRWRLWQLSSMWPIEDLDALLVQRGCNWLDTFFISSPQTLEGLTVCQTTKRTLAAAPYLVIASEKLAKEGRIDEAIQGFTEAKRWDSRLTFDPTAKAMQIAPP